MSILAHDTMRKQKYRVPWYLRTRDMIGKGVYIVYALHTKAFHTGGLIITNAYFGTSLH